MISSENFIYQWTFLCFLCLFDKSISVSSRDSRSLDPPYSKYKSLSKHWSQWTEWSECSRTCGGGVKMRTRVCRIRINGYGLSSNTCLGETVEREMCSKDSCLPHDRDFLEYQCSRRNGHVIAGNKIDQWIPNRYGSNPCELQCWSKDRTIVHSFGKAIDGTKCPATDPGQSAICVNGRCSPVDCTGKIGSTIKLDKCGVCGGNNSTCIKYENTFWRRPRIKTLHNDHHFEYEEIFSIPAGATSILIRKASRTNFLSLADRGGTYFINGNWRVQSPGHFLVYGSEFLYNRTFDGTEILSSTGPTKQVLVVFVLGSGDAPTIHCEYWLSKSPQNIYHSETTKQNSFSPKTFEPQGNSMPSSTISKMTVVPKIQGYNSYYHRNEILKSVPSWSIKRHSTYKNPLNILSFQTHSSVIPISVRTNAADGFYQRYYQANVEDESPFEPRSISNVAFLKKTPIEGSSEEDIVQLDSFGRPNGTSAQTSRNNKVFQYDIYERQIKQSDTKERNKTNKLKNGGKEKQSSNRRKSKLQKNQKTHNKQKRKSENENCSPCPKARHQTRNFCLSEFVLRVEVLSTERQQQSVRYEIEVFRSYKNKVPILTREYIWTVDKCPCPKLRVGREYILMGNSKTFGSQRESRLVVDLDSFVRRYSQKRARTMLRLVRDQNSICKKY